MRRQRILAAMGCALALGLASCASAPRAENAPAGRAAEASAAPAATAEQAAGGSGQAAQITWADDAWAAFQAEVPKAVQKIAKKQMEKEAREKGISVIDMDFYNEVKKEQGR
jgi:hypothetical protein